MRPVRLAIVADRSPGRGTAPLEEKGRGLPIASTMTQGWGADVRTLGGSVGRPVPRRAGSRRPRIPCTPPGDQRQAPRSLQRLLLGGDERARRALRIGPLGRGVFWRASPVVTLAALTANETEVWTMPTAFRVKHPQSHEIAQLAIPEKIQDFLRAHADWPPGTYEVLEVPPVLLLDGFLNRRWGVATKRLDGAVFLEQDPSRRIRGRR